MTFKSEIIFVRILAPFIFGIALAYCYPEKTFIVSLAVIVAALSGYLVFINSFYKEIKAYNFKGLNGFAFYLLWFSFGSILCLLHNQTLNTNYFGNKKYQYLKVWVNNEPEQSNDILRFQTVVTTAYEKDKSVSATGKLLIALKVDSLKPVNLKYGDELMITSEYATVEPPYNPGEFDFRSWLGAKNVHRQTFINQNQLIKLGNNYGNAVISYALDERVKQVAVYRKLIKNDEAFAVASTLVLGYRANLSKETLAAYSKTGTIHALSVSGAHVGIIFLLLNGLLSFLDRKRSLKIIKLLLICGLIWYYSLLTGFSSSVLRSAIMLTIFILAKALNKSSNNYNILSFAAFCLLIYNPFFIVDVGFQLSFVSVFGLIYLQPKIYKWIYVKNKLANKIWSTTSLSLAAQLVTFPLSVYYFHQFPVYFLLGNLFILIPLILMMYLGIAILVLKIYFIGPVFEGIITFTNNGLKWIAHLPFSGITSIWLNVWQFMLLSLALSLLVYSLVKYNKRILFASLLLLIAFQSYAMFGKLMISKQQKILFFSLRKNYATAFISADKAILITDLTPDNKNYQFFVQPGLQKLQVRDIVFLDWKSDLQSTDFVKKNHQVTFLNYRILLIDSSLNYKRITDAPHFEAVWLHENPKIKLEKLSQEVKFSSVLIDATNKDYKIEQYKMDANKFKLHHHVFKKNNSYLIDLNLKSQP